MKSGGSEIYFDNASTTFVDPAVKTAICALWEKGIGNAGSIHQSGVEAAHELELARLKIAKSIGASAEEIYFTSGGTESNNLAILGHFSALNSEVRGAGPRFACSAVEHSSVLAIRFLLESLGIQSRTIRVRSDGILSEPDLENALSESPSLVSVMHANNEPGVAQNLVTMAQKIRASGALLHVDACQSYTKLPLNVRDTGIDLLSICAHKIHGPKGIGALYVRKGLKIASLFRGGGQEFGIRPGTQNVEGAVGFAKAVEVALGSKNQGGTDWASVRNLRDVCAAGCEQLGFTVTAKAADRLPNILHISKSGLNGKKLMFELSKEKIFISLGSACHANETTPSHVLVAMGMPADRIGGALRVSFSKWNTLEQVERFLSVLEKSVHGGA